MFSKVSLLRCDPDSKRTKENRKTIKIKEKRKFEKQKFLQKISKLELFSKMSKSVICILSGWDSIISGDYEILVIVRLNMTSLPIAFFFLHKHGYWTD